MSFDCYLLSEYDTGSTSTTQGGGGIFKYRMLLSYRRGDLLRCMDGRANQSESCSLEWLQWSPQPQLLDVVYCRAVVVVVVVVVVA